MLNETASETKLKPPLNSEFLIFWLGKAISDLGTAFTQFGLPLLVFKLTGSAINLALATTSVFLPYLLFGLVIGAWADRRDRKRLMIQTNVLRALIMAIIPAVAAIQVLNVNWLYAVAFLNSTLAIVYGATSGAVVPSLVTKDQLTRANGRTVATTSAAAVFGPLLAGLLITIAPIETIFLVDSLSFLVPAFLLLLIKSSFNQAKSGGKTSIRQDILEGLNFFRRQPILLNVTILSTLINFIGISAGAQRVLLAKHQYGANDQGLSLLYAGGGIGAFVFSLLTGWLPKKWPLGRVAIGTMMLSGLLTLGQGLTNQLGVALVLYIISSGLQIIFNVQVISLGQAIVPNELLGRVTTTSIVLAWAVIPLGSMLGGALVEWTGNIGLLYQLIGGLIFLTAVAFLFTPLNRSKLE